MDGRRRVFMDCTSRSPVTARSRGQSRLRTSRIRRSRKDRDQRRRVQPEDKAFHADTLVVDLSEWLDGYGPWPSISSLLTAVRQDGAGVASDGAWRGLTSELKASEGLV